MAIYRSSIGSMYKSILPNPSQWQPRRQYRARLPLSFLSVILVVLGLQFLVVPRYFSRSSPNTLKLSRFHSDRLNSGLQKCAEYNTPNIKYPVTTAQSRTNPRWNPVSGQNETVVLRNATLFDGETILTGFFDITFKSGIIDSIAATEPSTSTLATSGVRSFDLEGKFVTPGLIDLHSHHLVMPWPLLAATDDSNEVNPDFGPLTPFVRAIDSIKAYDEATTIIASGGVTSSLILPGSANIMGGEGFLVKNVLRSGPNGEEVVEELLLEHGVPKENRRRYLKMACGENPLRVYKHTRMGNAWIFRKHMERAKEVREKQDAWCLSAAALRESDDAAAIVNFMETRTNEGLGTESLELDSTIAMLRGKIGINVHCYETEDFEDMLRHSKEFGFRIQAFHHALSAWQVPELIKDSGENITIATFAEFGFYKKEAYEANLWAGKILAEHGVPVAYKSDHVMQETNAKYLLFQAATAHSFHLSQTLALQSVTSVPARSLEIDHRVGFVRAGYDADIVVWDSHPLSVGATPLQVYIDGEATLDPKKVAESQPKVVSESRSANQAPKMRKILAADAREKVCGEIQAQGAKLIIKGIKRSYVDYPGSLISSKSNLTMVIDNGQIICLDADEQCMSSSVDGTIITLENGYVLPGLTAVSASLGLTDIASDDSTGDGSLSKQAISLTPENVVYAKYGVHLDGKSFKRARIAGITRAISTPISEGGLSGGVSVGIKTNSKKAVALDDGIFQDDVALHFTLGQASKATDSIPTISSAIARLRQILIENKDKDNVYTQATNGSIPLVVHAENEYDIAQLIKIKKDYPVLNLVIMGGSGAPHVAIELADAKIPVILTANRGAPDSWEKRNALVGPPLSKSPAAVLADAGVTFGLAISGEGDSHIHNLPIEASWAAKYAGLGGKEAVDLVSRNIEKILGLEIKEEKRDFVVWEGNPLEFGASVVLSFDREEGRVGTCWPEST